MARVREWGIFGRSDLVVVTGWTAVFQPSPSSPPGGHMNLATVGELAA
jgi:hypothetical protein